MPKLLDPLPDLFSQVWIRYRIRDIVRVTILLGVPARELCERLGGLSVIAVLRHRAPFFFGRTVPPNNNQSPTSN
jgi:hypothetical protein